MLRGLTMTPEQIQLEMAHEQAIVKHGKKFITLRLLDMTKNRIQGAIVLHATPFLNSMTNLTEFHFEERGGPLEFRADDFKGGYYCRMLDCEHNRKFLASMYETGYWVIEEPQVEEQVKEAAQRIRDRMIKVKPVNVDKIKTMNDDQLTAEMARLQGEAARRTLQKQKAEGKIKDTEVIEPVETPEVPKEETKEPEDTKPAPALVQKNRPGRPKLVSIE